MLFDEQRARLALAIFQEVIFVGSLVGRFVFTSNKLSFGTAADPFEALGFPWLRFCIQGYLGSRSRRARFLPFGRLVPRLPSGADALARRPDSWLDFVSLFSCQGARDRIVCYGAFMEV